MCAYAMMQQQSIRVRHFYLPENSCKKKYCTWKNLSVDRSRVRTVEHPPSSWSWYSWLEAYTSVHTVRSEVHRRNWRERSVRQVPQKACRLHTVWNPPATFDIWMSSTSSERRLGNAPGARRREIALTTTCWKSFQRRLVYVLTQTVIVHFRAQEVF